MKRFLLPVLLIALGAYHFVYEVVRAAPAVLPDLEIYLQAASRLAAGHSPYMFRYSSSTIPVRDFYYFYPPLLLVLVQPMLELSTHAQNLLWCLLSYLALLGAAATLTATLRRFANVKLDATHLFSLTLVGFICFRPAYWGFIFGQVDALILLLLSLWIFCSLKKCETVAGSMLALAAWIKMSPAVLLLAAIRFRRWRTITAFVLVTILIGALLLVGPLSAVTYQEFATIFHAMSAGALDKNFNQNFGFIVSVLDTFGLYQNQILQCCLRAILITLLVYCFRETKDDQEGQLLFHSILLCFMLLLSPVIWYRHLAWLLIPLAVTLTKERKRPAATLFIAAALISSAMLQATAMAFRADFLANLLRTLPPMLIFALIWLLIRKRVEAN